MAVKLTDRNADIIVCGVLLALGGASLPYLLHYSAEIAFASIRAEDELAFLRVVDGLLAPNFSIAYFKLFNSFSYGALWWAILAVTAAPFKLLGSEQGMVVSIRLLSLVSSLAAYYFAYAAVRPIITRRLEVFAGAVALIVVCFFSQLVFITSTYIHPETMYCTFLMLSFHQLVRAQGQVNRNFYWSVVWLIVAISIKLLAALFGVVYLLFWWLGPRNFDWRTMLRIAGIVLVTALVLNPWVLQPDLLRDAIASMRMQSGVTRTGWPELHYTWTLAKSIDYFSDWYVGIGVLLGVLLLALLTAGFVWGAAAARDYRTQTGRLFFMSFAVVVVYAVFCLFYAWQPIHYGIPLLYMLPVLVVSMLDLLPVFQMQHATAPGWRDRLCGGLAAMLVVGGFCWAQQDHLVSVYNVASQPAGDEHNLARYGAIQKIRDILERYPVRLGLVGVAHDLAVPLINGKRIEYWHLNALPGDLVGRSDVLIFWKPDSVYGVKFIKREPTDPATFEVYNRIREGRSFSANGKSVRFKIFFEDDQFEVYERTEGDSMTVRSASTSRRHQAERAVDGSTSPDNFWEAEGPYPHAVTFSYPAVHPVARYELAVGELATRMPRAWQFAGSQDGKSWVELDKRVNEKPWTAGETRSYSLRTAAAYPFYQLTFTEGYEPNILRIYEITLK